MWKVCFLSNAILEKVLEMTRNLCAHPVYLLNPTISKFAVLPIWKKFRTWFFQMFFNKSLIKCEKFVSCLMQYSKKYWKWPETYLLILHGYWTPQFQNFAIPPIWLSSDSLTQRYCYPCITFSLYNFKLLTIC